MAGKISRNDIPPFLCNLRPETAAALHHILMAEEQHAKLTFEQTGFKGLLNFFEVIRGFYDGLAVYLNDNYK